MNADADNLEQGELLGFNSPYGKRLRHPRWQRRRLEAMLLADWRCSRCRDSETRLEVHHKSYRPGLEPWEYPLSELSVLCERCHEFEHVPVAVYGCCMGGCGDLHTNPPGYERPCDYNQDVCFRYRRMGAVLAAMSNVTKRRLRSLYDHKGILTAYWKFTPADSDQKEVAKLWATIAREDWSDDYVQHTIEQE